MAADDRSARADEALYGLCQFLEHRVRRCKTDAGDGIGAHDACLKLRDLGKRGRDDIYGAGELGALPETVAEGSNK